MVSWGTSLDSRAAKEKTAHHKSRYHTFRSKYLMISMFLLGFLYVFPTLKHQRHCSALVLVKHHRGEIHRGWNLSSTHHRCWEQGAIGSHWMSLVSMGSRVQITRTNFVVPMGNYSKRSYIMVMPMVIQCYQMVIILLQFIETIFIQIWNQLTQRFCGSQWIKWTRNLKMN